MQKSYLEDRVLGSLWGGVLGDVIGAHLEFDQDVTNKKVLDAFRIIGGGKHDLEPGQPTDDTQLNFSILKGVLRGKGKLNLNYIAEEMGNWFLSKPIDVGGTIRNSIPKACNMKTHQAHLCRKGAKERSQSSQSNGSLMGITSLSIWVHRLPPDELQRAIREYTILIHPNELVIWSNTLYCHVMSYLLRHHSEEDRALKAFAYGKNQTSRAPEEFKGWIGLIEESFADLPKLMGDLPTQKASGWVRVALSYALHFLVSSKDFKHCIEELIRMKGDTDTNACIMGGLLGAYYGLAAMKMDQQIEKISEWRPKKKYRPDWMVPGLVVNSSVKQLIDCSPKELRVVGSVSEYK